MRTKEEIQEYQRKYYLKNKEKMKENSRKSYECRKTNGTFSVERKNEKLREWRAKKPWLSSYYAAKYRCTNRNCFCYKNYGARGIEFHLTTKEIEYLWFRDDALNMKTPTIDRIDNDGNYQFDNCRFIEKVENSRRTNLGKHLSKKHRENISKGVSAYQRKLRGMV